VLQFVAVCCCVLGEYFGWWCSRLRVAVCAAVCCSLVELQCVAVCVAVCLENIWCSVIA